MCIVVILIQSGYQHPYSSQKSLFLESSARRLRTIDSGCKLVQSCWEFKIVQSRRWPHLHSPSLFTYFKIPIFCQNDSLLNTICSKSDSRIKYPTQTFYFNPFHLPCSVKQKELFSLTHLQITYSVNILLPVTSLITFNISACIWGIMIFLCFQIILVGFKLPHLMFLVSSNMDAFLINLHCSKVMYILI